MLIRILLCFILIVPNAYAAKLSRPRTEHLIKCDALGLALDGYFDEARRCAYKQQDRALAKLVHWLYYQDRRCEADFKEISEFLATNPSFPEKDTITRRAEDKITPDTPTHDVEKWFAHHQPQTGNGIKYYTLLALPAIKKQDDLIKAVRYGWINGNFNNGEREGFLAQYGKFLTTRDHIAKANVLISKGNTKIDSDILRLLPANYIQLIKARVALLDDQSNFIRIIQKVPQNLRNDPGLLLAEASWYKQKGHHHKLAKMLYDNQQNKALGTDSWFKIRTSTAAELMDTGDYKLAYAIAKSHNYTEAVNYVDGEWLAGRIAYFYLRQPKLAIEHFKNIFKKAKFSVSKAKGAYWVGMAARKLDDKKLADEYFAQATNYPDTFYGQLAVMHRGKDHYIVLDKDPVVSADDLHWFENDQLIRISKLLIQKKRYSLAEKFMKSAIAHNQTPARILLVVRLGYNINLPRLSVSSGKEAIRHGCFLPKHIYPTLKFSPNPDQIEKAMMLSIIRQESEFDHNVVSSAEAMGLMQLVYPTAKDVGNELGVRFKKQDLTGNPKLNLTFGCHYLSKSVDYYGGSYILAAAAYNAGAGNVNKWIEKYGDPRKFNNLEQVVSWIEKIPFYETRGYIHHVMANLQIYRGLLEDNKAAKIKINLDEDLMRGRD